MLVILSKDIQFKDFDGRLIHLKEGTEVYVDIQEMIACHDNINFDILRNEFIVIN